jgi:hypothetical protein
MQEILRFPDFLAKFKEKAIKVTLRPGEENKVEPARIPIEDLKKAYDEFP